MSEEATKIFVCLASFFLDLASIFIYIYLYTNYITVFVFDNFSQKTATDISLSLLFLIPMFMLSILFVLCN